MDPRRARTERNMLPQVGPQFFREADAVLFQYIIDPGNVLGPRPANREDQKKHAGAWAAFIAAEGVSALDRDASGEAGGSLASESPDVVAANPWPEHPTADFDDAMEVERNRLEADAAVSEPPRQKRKYTRRQVA